MNILKSLAILIGVLSLATISTHSVFTSQASVVGNEFSTGTFPTPTPSNGDTIRICHATGQEGNYQSISPSPEGVINGHVGPSHQGGRDIIPPFDYGDPIQHFAGQNWDAVGQAIWNNNCVIPAVGSFQSLGAILLSSPSPSISPTASPEVSPSESPSPIETPTETPSPVLTE